MRHYYKLLGLDKDATLEEIKKAYHAKAKEYHPDNSDKGQEYLLREVTEAYKALSASKKNPNIDVVDFVKRRDMSKQKTESSKTTNNYHKKDVTFKDKIKREYERSLKIENYNSFKRRCSILKEILDEEYPFLNETSLGRVVKPIFGLSVCALGETMTILSKLNYTKLDNPTRYVIRNRKTIAALLVAGTIASGVGLYNNINEKDTDDKVITNEQETKGINITRIYHVKAGDTLSELSYKSNTTIKAIKSRNALETENIKSGDTLYIPYVVEKEDLEVATDAVEYDNSMSLDEFAENNNTTASSLKNLNEEAIIKINNKYSVISDTLLVPNFKDYNELENLKKSDIGGKKLVKAK